MEIEKIAQEKTEMQRHYVMVSCVFFILGISLGFLLRVVSVL